MNILWPILIIISYLFALLSGNLDKVNSTIFSSVNSIIELSLVMLGNMCLWCGIMNILKNTRIMGFLKKLLYPLIKWLYPDEKNNKEVMNEISMNMVSNLLGIGNAATPAGLKAMELMKANNKVNTNTGKSLEISNSMAMLVVLNTTSIQLIPTTVMAIRASLGAANPSEIIFPIWIATFVGTTVGIISIKILLKFRRVKQL